MKYIYINKKKHIIVFRKKYNNKWITKSFPTLVEAICYKYIIYLRLKAGHTNFSKSRISYWRD